MGAKRTKIMEQDGCQVRILHIEQIRDAQESMPPEIELDRLALMFKVLGNSTRLKILSALIHHEMCVCDLAVIAGITESAVSHQLRRLKDLGLVRQRRDGQILFNTLEDAHVADLIETGLIHIRE